ncbi:hypothetical protein ABZ835_44000 [Streptomyces sp. NPDC047461]|uniref:DUF2933 domain-containing protein n=1 Tax=Streptomyces sp. NPDC047461 TaxID=3155619 RepID=UPI0033C40A92
MNTSRHDYGLYAIAVAITVVGALALDLPVAPLACLAIVLAWPLMTDFMMRGRHGGHDTSHESRADVTAKAPGNRSAPCPL